jgi:hypothetical protein
MKIRSKWGDHANVGNSRLAEGPYRLLDEVEARHEEPDARAALDVFFHENKSGGSPGLAGAGR